MTDYKLVPVRFCEDTALSLAERTFSTEVDEQLAEDVIQYARRLHDLYTAPQPAEQQPDPTDIQILAITTAYEQGVGKGHDAHRRGEEIQNPYGTSWGCDKAWQLGYEEGKEQAVKPRPVPDVTALVEALECAKNLIANHSGEVLPDEYAGDQIEQIDAALAAHFKRDSQPNLLGMREQPFG